jgi:hypothetical protein
MLDVRELASSASSLTESEISSQITESTECSSLWSYSDATGSPPKVIKISDSRSALESTTFPYAQLCFDPERKILVTLMEICLSGNGQRSKRLRIIDPRTNSAPPEETPSSLMIGSLSTSGTETTLSTCVDASPVKAEEPIFVLGTQGAWLEETDPDLYLLHECEDPWCADSKSGCTKTLRKLIVASRSFLVFSIWPRERSWEAPSNEAFIGYKMLDNETGC